MVSSTAISVLLTFSHRLLAPLPFKRVGCLLEREYFEEYGRDNHIHAYGLTWPADWSDRASLTACLAQSGWKCSVVCRVTTLVAGSRTAQPLGSRPPESRVITHGQQVALLGALTPLEGCSRRILLHSGQGTGVKDKVQCLIHIA